MNLNVANIKYNDMKNLSSLSRLQVKYHYYVITTYFWNSTNYRHRICFYYFIIHVVLDNIAHFLGFTLSKATMI